mmetsp:Transcript_14297/g.40955  ORF Transcript_14297/g.40955 Transcript_14297/m.40955 type:complete len:187 (+) Transcript_14297:65-625(+)
MTMKAQLQALQRQDPASVFIARRINRLGFSSPEQLRAHFGRFGEVAVVHVAHSLVKSARPPGAGAEHRRQRPAALGFVVMSSPEATERILEEGPEHVVNGVKVTVQAFHRHSEALEAEEEEEDEGGGGQAAEEAGDLGCHAGSAASLQSGKTSPVCPVCGSTVAMHLGVTSCQVCKRWWAYAGPWY